MDTKDMLRQKLDEYGEKFLATHEVRKKKKKDQKCVGKDNTDNLDDEPEKASIARMAEKMKLGKKRKRRKKKKKSGPDDVSENCPKSTDKKGGAKCYIEQMKKELGLEDFKEKLKQEKVKEELQERLVETKDQKHQPEVIVFHSRRKEKVAKEKKNKETKKSEDNTAQEVDLKTARYDVRKFGISGAKGDDRDDAMRQLLMRLGAKPPKNKYYNYKEFQEMKKKQKQTAVEQKTWDRAVGNKISKEGKKKDLKRKRDKDDIDHVDSKVGKFRSGVLFLNKKDIDQIKSTIVPR